jgi:aldose 1-epimerase
VIELRNGDASVTVFPAAGGRVAELRVDDLALLVDPTDEPLHWGCFPMVPFAGRLRHGLLHFGGATYELPLNMPPHAIHGTVTTAEWMVDDATEDRAALRVDLGPDWPFRGHALQQVALHPDRLDLALEVHADEEPMPATCGWHPWFRRQIARNRPNRAAELDFRPRAMWVRGSDGIPTGEVVEPTPGPWDDCFSDLDAPPAIRWPGELEITLRSPSEYWVVYTEPEHALCVEPQTGPPDGPNQMPYIVRPGEPLVASFSLAWTRAT